MGIEKLNAEMAEGIEHTDRLKGISIERVTGMSDTSALFFIQTMRCSP